MITGRQIREARELMRWSAHRLAEKSKLQVSTVGRAEATDGEPAITLAQVASIQDAFEKAGVTFMGGTCGFRTVQPVMLTGRPIREARLMLGWSGDEMCRRANIDHATLTRAEAVDGAPVITLGRQFLIRDASERAGVRFGQNGAVMRVTIGEGTPAR